MKQNLDFRRPTVDDIIMKGTLAFWEAIYSRAKSLNGNWRETTVEQSSVVQNYSLPLQVRLARSAQQTFAFRWRPCWRQFAGLFVSSGGAGLCDLSCYGQTGRPGLHANLFLPPEGSIMKHNHSLQSTEYSNGQTLKLDQINLEKIQNRYYFLLI